MLYANTKRPENRNVTIIVVRFLCFSRKKRIQDQNGQDFNRPPAALSSGNDARVFIYAIRILLGFLDRPLSKLSKVRTRTISISLSRFGTRNDEQVKQDWLKI